MEEDVRYFNNNKSQLSWSWLDNDNGYNLRYIILCILRYILTTTVTILNL